MPVKKVAAKKVVVKKAAVKKAIVKKSEVEIKTSKVGGLNASVYSLTGKVVGSVLLPKEIFAVKINDTAMSQAVRVYLANKRTGNPSTKGRGEVTGSTRKIYKQKGTGRARHGGIRAPLFVGGGIAFGPKPHDFSLKMPQKMKKAALFSALSTKLKDNEIKILTGLEKIEPKTKIVADALSKLAVINSKILLITPSSAFDNVYKAGRNIRGVNILPAGLINTYEVLDNKMIILMKDSIDSIKNTFIK